MDTLQIHLLGDFQIALNNVPLQGFEVARPQGAGYDVGAVEYNWAKPNKPVLVSPKQNAKIKKYGCGARLD